jgi:hypothetical protein
MRRAAVELRSVRMLDDSCVANAEQEFPRGTRLSRPIGLSPLERYAQGLC